MATSTTELTTQLNSYSFENAPRFARCSFTRMAKRQRSTEFPAKGPRRFFATSRRSSCRRGLNPSRQVSERSEIALRKTGILAMDLAKWAADIMATSTTELTLYYSTRFVFSRLLLSAQCSARRRTIMLLAMPLRLFSPPTSARAA